MWIESERIRDLLLEASEELRRSAESPIPDVSERLALAARLETVAGEIAEAALAAACPAA